ncbi:SDR family oxidoreductase [Streptomyces sp. NBC_00239]|uniref:SDR family oxidoreductase n=1 Tax=Streptomyces sp. NBC_00239 TaxID=2903640 RepID=UPI002E2A9DFA|nr:NAD(P)H-binding protein [Streptomyces sp. NBC_00239]
MSTILVTGGTGTLGAPVVARLRAAGHEVRALSRRSSSFPVDLTDGSGLDAALAGVDTVVHCASSTRQSGKGDDAAAGHLIGAARRAGVGHLVYISIVGVDVVPFGYYKTKLKVERMLEQSGLGVTILRATQFHDLVAMVTDMLAKLPVVLVPAVPDQPIAVEEVADRLAELAAAAPAGRVADLGGPLTENLPDLARRYLRARGSRRPVVPVRLPGKTFRAFRAGGHLAPVGATGKRTFDEFLHDRATAGTV